MLLLAYTPRPPSLVTENMLRCAYRLGLRGQRLDGEWGSVIGTASRSSGGTVGSSIGAVGSSDGAVDSSGGAVGSSGGAAGSSDGVVGSSGGAVGSSIGCRHGNNNDVRCSPVGGDRSASYREKKSNYVLSGDQLAAALKEDRAEKNSNDDDSRRAEDRTTTTTTRSSTSRDGNNQSSPCFVGACGKQAGLILADDPPTITRGLHCCRPVLLAFRLLSPDPVPDESILENGIGVSSCSPESRSWQSEWKQMFPDLSYYKTVASTADPSATTCYLVEGGGDGHRAGGRRGALADSINSSAGEPPDLESVCTPEELWGA